MTLVGATGVLNSLPYPIPETVVGIFEPYRWGVVLFCHHHVALRVIRVATLPPGYSGDQVLLSDQVACGIVLKAHLRLQCVCFHQGKQYLLFDALVRRG